MITKDQMQQYAATRKKFAEILETTEAYIQKGNDEIIEFCKLNDGSMSAEEFVTLASDHEKIVHKFFNWAGTPEERLAQASLLLSMIPFLVGSDNRFYEVKSEEV